jgi:2-polyprenyl-6-methoxyphenol hydroxylase-like FAD-dependent oxidoreductase
MSTIVTVIGAGLGGLTLARILQRNGIGVVVYDLDAGLDARPQGGMLDMHEESGQTSHAGSCQAAALWMVSSVVENALVSS